MLFHKKEKKEYNILVKDDQCKAYYSLKWKEWQIIHDGIEYTLESNELDLRVMRKIPDIANTIDSLRADIRECIAGHLEGWCKDTKNEKVASVDVTKLLEEDLVVVSYAGGDEWGDLVVNIVVQSGKIVDSYAGD